MLRITKLTDYAIVVLTCMAERDAGEHHSTASLAEYTSISQPTVRKILKDLAKGGIVVSQRGVQGGYQLSRSACEITLVDIIDAVEGPIALTECSGDEPDGCEHVGSCRVEANWLKINQVVRRALQRVNLSDMTRNPQQQLVTLGGHRPTKTPGAERAPAEDQS